MTLVSKCLGLYSQTPPNDSEDNIWCKQFSSRQKTLRTLTDYGAAIGDNRSR